MILYTIGFTKKSAEEFFDLLINNGVKRVIDIRFNNKSQLTGFTKAENLAYFLRKIAGIEYRYMPVFAPAAALREAKAAISWSRYAEEYLHTLENRNVLKDLDFSMFDNACLLCSEETPQTCHRSVLAEFLAAHAGNMEVIHL